MRCHVITTGLVFPAMTLLHVARFVLEGAQVPRDPVFVVTSALAVALVAWAWRLPG